MERKGTVKIRLFIGLLCQLLSMTGSAQPIEKQVFNPANPGDYYLSIQPQNPVRGVLVLFTYAQKPSTLPAQTRLHGVAADNGILTVYASLEKHLVADSSGVARINAVLNEVTTRFSVDTAVVALAGFGLAGNMVLRYTELAYAHPEAFPVRPKAVFCIGSFIDLLGLAGWCHRAISKNYFGGDVKEAKAILTAFGTMADGHRDTLARLRALTPFNKEAVVGGHEQFLNQVPVRLYYDGDLVWELNRRHKSLYDNPVADGSELVSRLLQAGNPDAELILSRLPGYRNNGIKDPVSLSIVDETDCIQWLMRKLNLFNPVNPLAWKAPYVFPVPPNWTVERTAFPPAYSPHVPYRGFEEIHFPPGWGDRRSADYWTVSYLFRLNGPHRMDAPALEDFLKVYYEGLIEDNVPRRNIPPHKRVPVSARLQKVNTEPGDLETYDGVVHSLDYLAQVPLLLHCRVHVKPGGGLFSALIVDVSPQPFEHSIWRLMGESAQGFECGTGRAD